MIKAYKCSEDGQLEISCEMQSEFEEKGYVVITSLLNEKERQRLLNAVENDKSFTNFAYGRDDGSGRQTKVVLWNLAGNDITGVVARSEKVAGTMEKLLGGEIYHYHSKIIKKDAHTGGMHVWHQDYGYWYNNGCLYPRMGTVFIALDRAYKENGCLQILEGSHHMGRIDHVRIGDQNGIDEKRMPHILKEIPPTHVELNPGDALFFHSNVMHKSNQNHSEDRRWAFLCAYNRKDNNPVIKHHHPQYTKMTKVSNSNIMSCPLNVKPEEKDFFFVRNDISLQGSHNEQKV